MRNKRLIIISIVLNSILLIFELFSVSEVFLRYLPDATPFPWYYTITYYKNNDTVEEGFSKGGDWAFERYTKNDQMPLPEIKPIVVQKMPEKKKCC